ncbi:hypothetical protein Q3G72_012225 [Acer saccharum]|nr:hypothetical protein Q3G72_012225 [Acer saccharum]
MLKRKREQQDIQILAGRGVVGNSKHRNNMHQVVRSRATNNLETQNNMRHVVRRGTCNNMESSTRKKTRGRTRLQWLHLQTKPIQVKFNELRQPIGKPGKQLRQYIGFIDRVKTNKQNYGKLEMHHTGETKSFAKHRDGLKKQDPEGNEPNKITIFKATHTRKNDKPIHQKVANEMVKQKKKSSNKWTCVVCNQKQSVRKVFAQGYNAKDLRQYVQSFNMSLKDRPHEEQQEEEETEMPNKKPKLTNSSEEGEGYDQFYKSIFSSQAQVRDMEAEESQQSRAKVDSKWKDYLSEEDEEPRTSQPTMNNATQEDMKNPRNCQTTMGKAASKWSEYLTEDDREENDLQDHKRKLSNGVFKTTTNEQEEVEDDIHPDFI